MAALDFDDGDKKSRDILDLSLVTIQTEAELNKWLEKIPDFKIRPEKVRQEDATISEEGLNSAGGSPTRQHGDLSRAAASASASYPFCDPVPTSMKDVCIKELGRVNINWRMLTVARPKTKLEEDIFSRFVQLEKLQHKTVVWEIEQDALKEHKSSYRGVGARGRARAPGGRGASTKSAVTERRVQTCRECGEEFCSGTCKKYLYDDHARTLNPIAEDIFKIGQRLSKKAKKTSSEKRAASEDAAANNHNAENDAGEKTSAGGLSEPKEGAAAGARASPAGKSADPTSNHSNAADPKTETQTGTTSSLKTPKEKGAKSKLQRVGKKTNKSKKR